MAIRTRRRKSTAPRRRVKKASSVLSDGLKLAAALASATMQAIAPKAALSPKTRKSPKTPPARKTAKAAKIAKAASVAKPVSGRSAPSSFRAGKHDCALGNRDYKIFKPGRAAPAPPLLVMLHGCGQTPDDFATGTRMNALAKERGLIVLYPAQSRSAHPNRCWNWFLPGDQGRDAGEPAILASLVRQIIRTHGVDPARVYIAGLSAGASMALIMARAFPDLFAAVGVHSGLVAGAAHDQASAMLAMHRGNPGWRLIQPMPTIVFHGSLDAAVNPRNGRLVAIRAREAYGTLRDTETAGQVPLGRAWRRNVHRIGSGRPLVERWVVTGSGHAWSGGSSSGRFCDPKGPDASREMVRFFLRHNLSARRRAALAKASPVPQS